MIRPRPESPCPGVVESASVRGCAEAGFGTASLPRRPSHQPEPFADYIESQESDYEHWKATEDGENERFLNRWDELSD